MPVFTQFSTPAGQAVRDFQQQPELRAAFEQSWSAFVNRSVETSQLGNPWTAVNDSPRALYFNPLGMDIDEAALAPAPVQWNAFPNRLNAYLQAQYGLTDRWKFADEGVAGLQCPQNPCSATPTYVAFKPYGPRGWQDEYCEWAVTRNAAGNITSVMFTCENPEYWFLLWNVSPDLVVTLYQQTLGTKEVQAADLYLRDAAGQPVIDPQTQRPAYNPINKWNSGTKAAYDQGAGSQGGAMHLTSPPNSLGAEIYLAGAATIQRYNGASHITVADKLICCAQYGQPNRNSDPHIGQSVNQVVFNGGGQPNQVTLLDPVGLYLQLPDAGTFTAAFSAPKALPAGKTLMDCWTVTRGTAQYAGYPNNAALHLVFAIPEDWGFTVSDLTMQYTSAYGEAYTGPVRYGAQLVEFLQVQLAAIGLPATAPVQNLQCVQDAPAAATLPVPSFLMDMGVYQASLANQLDRFANLTPQILTLAQGQTRTNVSLAASNVDAQTTLSFGDGVTATVTAFDDAAQLFTLTISVAPDAAVGERALLLGASGQQGVPAPGYLQIVPAPAAAPVAARAQHRLSRF
ncbi:hypothetical protein [Hymenobacter jeollabukensis]|uniref:Ig-like domain-containing protein n=1 Tax=Hymenobacter jeollabukensis TaxID=2025313 RepID=A0A5R8WJU8_9BACT|nr:hypothetical protein [Hymenobacter jeollabukensis]TLM89058.1 hypothetical protein FDY95_21040 [Hymenobacter jeollabukensis]